MWDTSEDYRLLVAKQSLDLFSRTLSGAKFRGHWDKKGAQQAAEEMEPIIEEMRYSYMEPLDLAESDALERLQRKADDVVEALGGEDWYNEFRDRAEKGEREKVEDSIAKIRFFIRTVRNLDERLERGEIDDPVIGIDVRVGDVMSVRDHPDADELLVCNVNIGDRAVSVVTNDLEVGDGDRVGVALLPPNDFMGLTSEGMFLGADEGVLRNIEGEIGELPEDVPLEAFNESRNLINDFLSD